MNNPRKLTKEEQFVFDNFRIEGINLTNDEIVLLQKITDKKISAEDAINAIIKDINFPLNNE